MTTQRLGDIVTIVVGVVVLGVLGIRYLAPVPAPTPVRLDASVGVDFAAGAPTLIMALSEDCVFCRESMPFYRRLLEQDTDTVQIVVAGPANEPDIESTSRLNASFPTPSS